MLLSPKVNQKGTRKLLVDSLYKKGYCLCIPDPQLIKFQFQQVSHSWAQKLLLSQNNTFKLSIIPMFLLIFVKNKCLTTEQNKHLLELIDILISQAEMDTIDKIFFEKDKQNVWIYCLLAELMKLTFEDFISAKNNKRIITLATAIELLFDKADSVTVTNFTLNNENIGFNVLHKLFYIIGYKSLHPNQIRYLSAICRKLIAKTNHYGIETLSFQIQLNGFSFIWSILATWLQIVFEPANANQFKIKYYTRLIDCLFNKIPVNKLSSILLEKETSGYIIILRYFFFKRFRHADDFTELFHFKRWCQIIFSALSFQEIELILDNLPLILSNNSNLNAEDRQELIQNFFTYLFEFCHLQPLEISRLKELQEQFEDRFSDTNVIKFFKQLSTCCSFFKTLKLRGSSINKAKICRDENSDLLPEYARLNANYLTMNN